jgi:hypothetical protein
LILILIFFNFNFNFSPFGPTFSPCVVLLKVFHETLSSLQD